MRLTKRQVYLGILKMFSLKYDLKEVDYKILSDIKDFLENTEIKNKDHYDTYLKSFGLALYYIFAKKYTKEYTGRKLAEDFDTYTHFVDGRVYGLKKKYPRLNDINEFEEDRGICVVCGQKYPRTEEYFYKREENIDGLERCCKNCNKKRGRKSRKYKKIREFYRGI